MGARLQESYADLEKKVEQRTARTERVAGAANRDREMFSRSSAARPSTCSRCSTRWWKPRRGFATPRWHVILRRKAKLHRAGCRRRLLADEYIEFLQSHPIPVDRGTVDGPGRAASGGPCRSRMSPAIPSTPLTESPVAGRATHPAWRAAAARARADRRDRAGAPTGQGVHAEADRTGHDLRRSGGDRHRERPAVRRVAGAHRRTVARRSTICAPRRTGWCRPKSSPRSASSPPASPTRSRIRSTSSTISRRCRRN